MSIAMSRVLGRFALIAAVLASPRMAPAADTAAASPADSKTPPRLLWVPCKYSGPAKERLVESEKLTVEEYRRRGVEVIEMKWADHKAWREADGKDWAKAHKYVQYIAYARGLNVDAVGGLSVFEVSSDLAANLEGMKAGEVVHGWGIALRACTSSFMLNFETQAQQAQAIPMALVKEEPWSIPRAIDAKSCTAGGGVPDLEAEFSKGRPFVGVMLSGATVANVVLNSPAKDAGITTGDLFVSVDGKPIKELADLGAAMEGKKPGDEVAIEIERNGERMTKSVKLADRAEVNTKNSPEGKPLPELAGKDINGQDVRLADLKGKVVMLDFWATWCGPCVEEMPLLQLTWDTLKDKGLAWVGVSADDDESAWREFVKENRLGGVQVRDLDWVSQMSVNGYPTIYLVDKGGVVNCNVRGGTIAQAAVALLQE